MAGLNPAERIQLVLDWHYDMQEAGHAVADRFDTTLISSYYHQLITKGVPLTHRQLRSLENIIYRWRIHKWMRNNPAAQGQAPAPPAPPAPEDEGFAFLSDDELDS
jgi:hypothetical protein